MLMWKEFAGAAMLMICHMAANDKFNSTAIKSSAFIPFYCGLALTALQLVTCLISCTEFNPATDLLGRIVYGVSGGGEGTNIWNAFSLIVSATPFFGTIFGSIMYRSAVSWYWPALVTAEKPFQPPPVIAEDRVAMTELGIQRGTQVERKKLQSDPILPQKKVAVVEYQREPDYDEIAKYIYDVLKSTTLDDKDRKPKPKVGGER